MQNSGYDIIGDIHGYARELEELLDKLGYKERNGVFRHPERAAIFVGDLIDRGPENIRVVQIVRAMVEDGSAKVILGNHEYNAICFHTPDRNGGYLRPHTDKNIKQHRAFLGQYNSLNDSSVEINRTIDWFRSLPLFIEEDNIRIIHACWDKISFATIRDQLNPDGSLTDELIIKSSKKGSSEYHALETLLKGAEADLPDGLSFTDKDGHERRETRLKWWLQGSQSYRSAALVPKETEGQLPDNIPVPDEKMIDYSVELPPVFFGHYWMHGTPVLQSPNICCVDYSVAKAGSLVCYRWAGERDLSSDNFVVTAITTSKPKESARAEPETLPEQDITCNIQ